MVYCAFGVQFGGQIRPADDVDLPPCGSQQIGQAAFRHLTGAKDNRIGPDQFRVLPRNSVLRL